MGEMGGGGRTTSKTSAGHTPESAMLQMTWAAVGNPGINRKERSLHFRAVKIRKGLEIGFTKTNRHKKVSSSSTSTPQTYLTEGNGTLGEENKSHRCKSNYLYLRRAVN